MVATPARANGAAWIWGWFSQVTLVDDLLALARAEADELRLEIAPVAVGAIVEGVYQTLAPLTTPTEAPMLP